MAEIKASLVLEILGRPPEHIKETLTNLITKMNTEKGVKVTKKTIHDPIPVEKSDLFTAFAEIDVEVDSINNYFFLIFAYMPAHIELVSPEKLTLKNSELNELTHGLTQRLHQYEALSKRLVADRNMFAQKLQEIAPHLFKQNPQQPKTENKETSKPAKNKKKKSRSSVEKSNRD